MKKVDYRILSDVVCSFVGCTKHLKRNVIEVDPKARYCYKHYQLVVRKNPRFTRVGNSANVNVGIGSIKRKRSLSL